MKKHAEQCSELYGELAQKPVSELKQAATPCIDDHPIEEKKMSKSSVNSLQLVLQ